MKFIDKCLNDMNDALFAGRTRTSQGPRIMRMLSIHNSRTKKTRSVKVKSNKHKTIVNVGHCYIEEFETGQGNVYNLYQVINDRNEAKLITYGGEPAVASFICGVTALAKNQIHYRSQLICK